MEKDIVEVHVSVVAAVVVGFTPYQPPKDGRLEACAGVSQKGEACRERPVLQTVFHGVRRVCCGEVGCRWHVTAFTLVANAPPEAVAKAEIFRPNAAAPAA